MDFSNTLIAWYLQNRRALPWRETGNPYAIWLSEVILQQTRVAQGTPYFLAFMEAFPTVHHLAAAPEEKVLRLWQGLGYYSRARNLHAAAKHIAFDCGGCFPGDYAGLLKLKGVGEYTAAAIASIAYGENVPVVDGNVYRVLARYFGIETDISSSRAKKEFTAVAAAHLPNGQASLYNQAMMEFGALQCIPKNPPCLLCPLQEGCVAFNTGNVGSLPVKLKKTKVVARYFNYIVVKDIAGNVAIEKRTEKGIWHNLYQFPLIETDTQAEEDEVVHLITERFTGVPVLAADTIVHKLSHQHLSIRFWLLELTTALPGAVAPEHLSDYPFPIVIHNFITRHLGR